MLAALRQVGLVAGGLASPWLYFAAAATPSLNRRRHRCEHSCVPVAKKQFSIGRLVIVASTDGQLWDSNCILRSNRHSVANVDERVTWLLSTGYQRSSDSRLYDVTTAPRRLGLGHCLYCCRQTSSTRHWHTRFVILSLIAGADFFSVYWHGSAATIPVYVLAPAAFRHNASRILVCCVAHLVWTCLMIIM